MILFLNNVDKIILLPSNSIILSKQFFYTLIVPIYVLLYTAKERSNNLTKYVTNQQHLSTPTYEEVKVDSHSEATEMTANSACGLQHTPHY